jgi:hypothetical protein
MLRARVSETGSRTCPMSCPGRSQLGPVTSTAGMIVPALTSYALTRLRAAAGGISGRSAETPAWRAAGASPPAAAWVAASVAARWIDLR